MALRWRTSGPTVTGVEALTSVAVLYAVLVFVSSMMHSVVIRFSLCEKVFCLSCPWQQFAEGLQVATFSMLSDPALMVQSFGIL